MQSRAFRNEEREGAGRNQKRFSFECKTLALILILRTLSSCDDFWNKIIECRHFSSVRFCPFSGMKHEKAQGSTLKERLDYAKRNEGYYRKSEDGTLNIYGQIYDPQSGRLIDAFNRTYDFPELGALKLDRKEMGSSDQKIIEEFSQKTVKRILTVLSTETATGQSVIWTGAGEFCFSIPDAGWK